MKTKTTLKRRLISSLLALVMVLGFFPAEMIPAAHAAEPSVSEFRIYKQGNTWKYSVTFADLGTAGAGIPNYVFAIVPNVTDGNSSFTPYARHKTSAFNPGVGASFITAVNGTIGSSASTVTQFVQGNSNDYTYGPGGTVTMSGNLTHELSAVLNAMNGKTTSSGGKVNASTDKGIEMAALLWRDGTSNLTAGGVTTWEDTSGLLEAEPTYIEIRYNAGGKWEVNGTDDGSNDASDYSDDFVLVTLTNKDGTRPAILHDIAATGSIAADLVLTDDSDGELTTQPVNANNGTLNMKIGLGAYTELGVSGDAVIELPYTLGTDNTQAPLKVTIKLINESGWDTTNINKTYEEGKIGLDSSGGPNPAVATLVYKGSVSVDDGYTLSPGGTFAVGGNANIYDTSGDFPFVVKDSAGNDITYDETRELTYGEVFTVELKLRSDLEPGTYTDTFTVQNDAYNPTATFNITITVTEAAATEEYDVTFDLNAPSGTSPTPPTAAANLYPTQTVLAGSTATDPGAPSLTGYVFKGWNTAANGSGTALASKTVDGPGITFYAVWEKLPVVTFNANGATFTAAAGGGTTKNITVDATSKKVTTPPVASDMTYTNHVFQGWYTAASGGTAVDPSTKTFTADTTLYAHWGALYTVSFNLNGGDSAVPSPITQTSVGQQLTMPAAPTRTGSWVFAGWLPNNTGNNLIGAGGNYTPTADVTMYAQWKPTYAITFYPNWPGDGSAGTGAAPAGASGLLDTAFSGAGWSLPGNTGSLKKTGYRWKGWAEQGTTTILTGSLTTAKNWNLDAIWQTAPTISGVTTNPNGSIQLGDTVNLTGVVLTGPALDSTDSTLNPAGNTTHLGYLVDAAHIKWYIGGSEAVGTGMPLGTGTTSDAIPNYIPNGWKLYVEVQGNGDNVNGEVKRFHVGTVGVPTKQLEVKARLVDGTTYAGGNPMGSTALAAGISANISTTNVDNNYSFVGWSTQATGAAQPEGTLNAAGLREFDPAAPAAQGVNKAKFTMPSPLPGSDVTIYAVYERVPSYDVTVKMNPGVDSVSVVGGTQNGSITTDGSGVKTVKYTVKQGDTLTIVTNPATGYEADGFDLAGNTSSNYEGVLNATTSFICVVKGGGLTITAKAKLKPPVLQLTPNTGTGSEDTTTNNGVITAPTVTVTNTGGANAVIATGGVTVGTVKDGSGNPTSYTFTASGLAAGASIAAGTVNAATITLTPTTKLPAGTYTIPISVPYTAPGGATVTTSPAMVNVTYVVSATDRFNGTVKVFKDGVAWNDPSVTVSNAGSATSSKTGNTTTFTGLSIGDSHAVTVWVGAVNTGTRYDTSFVLGPGNTSVEVNFVTVTAKVDSADTDNTDAITSTSTTVTVGVDGTTQAVTSANLTGHTGVSKVVLKGSAVTLTAAISGIPGYNFEEWTKDGNQASTSATYTFVANENNKTYLAHLVKKDQVVLTYDGNYANAPDRDTSKNPTIGVPPAQTVDAGGTATVSSMKPVLGGYVFQGWADTPTGSVTHVGGGTGGTITMTGNKTIYAVWEKAAITAKNASVTGTYGSGFSYTYAAERNDGVSGLMYTVTGGNALPGGLTLNSTTGVISGIPYEVCTDRQVTITVTPVSGTSYRSTMTTPYTATATLTITVNKAQPTVTGISPVGTVVSGAALTSVGWDVTVVGPRYKGTPAANTASTAADWEQYTDTITYAITSGTKTGGLGVAPVTATGNKFAASPATSTSVTANFTPQAVGTGTGGAGDFDTAGKNNKQDSVWLTATGTKTINHNGNSPKIEVSTGGTADADFASNQSWLYATQSGSNPAHAGYSQNTAGTNGFVIAGTGTGADTVNAKQFNIKNNGTATTGTLSYNLGANSKFTIVGNGPTTLAAGASGTVTIVPNANLSVGTYTDTLTITDGSSTATIHVTFVVTNAKTFTATIHVDKQATGDTNKVTNVQFPAGLGLKLVNGSNETVVAAGHWVAADNAYKVTNLAVGETYRLVGTGLSNAGGGEYDTGLTITSNGASQTVTYYQIAVTKDPSDLTLSPNVSGGGWYMDGQYATLNTAASGSKGGDTYDFKQWEKGSDTYGGPLANVRISAGNVTYTAKYTLRAAGTSTVTYMDNTNTTGGSTYATFVVTNGQTHTVIAGPNRDGYVFKGWNTAMNGGGTAYAVGYTIPAATVQTNPTLYAQWDPAEIETWNNDTDTGTYGVPYSYTVPFPSTTDGAGVTLAATGLPGGLSFNAATGVISGTPYAMGSHTITVTATHNYWNGSDANHNYPGTNAALTKTFTLTLTVEKYTPVLSALTVTNVASDAAYSTATYTGVVTAPLLTTKGTTAADDVWTTTSWTVGYNPALTGANTQGTLAPNTPAATFTASGGSVAMTHTPDTTKADANGAVYNTIYKNATGTVEASLTNTYTMQVRVDPAGSWDTSATHDTWTARVGYKNDGTPANGASDTTNNKVSAQTFGLRNTGNQATGTLAYTWGTTGGDTSALFTLAGQPASLTAGDNGTFTIVPQTGLATGTYQDTLTIKNTNGYSVTVKVKIVVNDPSNYTVTINTDHYKLDNTHALENLHQGNVVLKNASGDVTLAGTAGAYTGSAVYGRTYTVEVNGYTVPNLTISVTTHEATVNLRQVTVTDDPAAGVTASSTVNKAYLVDGESVTVTYGTPATNYSFKQLEDTTENQVRATSGTSYSQPITKATAYKVVWRLADTEYTLSFDGNNQTSGTAPASITVAAGTSVILPGQLSLEKNGYVFKGWGEANNTTVNGTGFHLAGSSFTVNATQTLYAVWEAAAGGLYLRDKVITAYYGEDLSGQNLKMELVGTPVGAVTYGIVAGQGAKDPMNSAKWDGILSVGSTDAAIAGTPKLSGVDASTATTGQTYDAGPFTIKVKATDAGTSLDTPDANLTIRVEKAATQVDPADKPAVKSSVTLLPGDTFDPATQLDPGKVDALKQDKNTLQSDVPGTWALATGEDGKITSGTTTIRLTFTPFDIGFKPVDYDLPVTVGEKAINGATIKVAFPASGQAAPVKSDLAVTLVTDTVAGTPDPATTDVTISDVKWVGLTNDGKFDTTKDTTLIVVLKPTNSNNWPFVDNDKAFTGHFVNTDNSTLPGNPDVHLSHNSGEATLTYTWSAQDRPFEKVDVKVGQLSVGAASNTSVAPKEPTKYNIASYKWYNKGTNTEVTEFLADTLYDLVVTFEPVDGWKFGDVFANKADDADLSAIATVNDGKPAEGDKTNLAEGATGAAPTTVTVRYASFKPVAQTIVGIEWVSGNLATQDYYAITTTDQKAGGSDVKNTTDGVYGHSAHSAIYNNTMTSPLKYKLVYSNGNKSAEIVYGSDSGEKLVYGAAPVGTLPEMPANGHVFTNVSAPTDQSTYDGKNAYLAYTTGSNTFYAAAPVGTLTVRELKAQRIVPSRQWTTTELTFVAGVDTFVVPSGITATVNFNTDCALSKQETGFAYNATQTNGNNTHYYKLDTDGDGIPETAIASGAAMTTDMSGKTLYICYTDINNNEVYAPVGVLRTSGDTALKVWIDNPTPGTTDPKDGPTTTATTGGSSKPEYGETIKAVIDGTPTGPVEYKWYRDNGAGGWTLITGETGPTHTLTPDDIDKHIKVEITEGGTSGTVTSVNIPVGQRRTLKLDVTAVNKNYDGTATNGHTYATGDPATAANDFYLYNVINNDEVYVSAYAGTDKPNYAGPEVGKEITWPDIDETSKGYYTLGGAHGNYYRLGAQNAIAHRGEILADGVIHVDVSFQEVPIFDHVIPSYPMGVTDLRQTRPGDGATPSTAVSSSAAFADVTKWYTSYNPSGSKTPAAGTKFSQGTYTVEVKVQPVAGYSYDDSKTKFYFHFGVDEHVEVSVATADNDKGLIKNDDGTWTMYYTFDAVELVKIAHVNVSVPQPVVENTPNATGTMIQALGTDNSDRTGDVTMGAITWYKGETSTDTIAAPSKFEADGVYRAEFDLTTSNNYKYLNKATPEDSIDVDFTVSGVGPIVGVTATPFTDASNPVITSVTTSTTDANTKYHVVVLYKAISGGKVALTDVVVDASRATAAGVDKTGPQVIGTKPYALTTTTGDNKWEYWNTTSNQWVEMTDSKFEAGVDYRVTAKVRLTDTQHYEITTATKFYLAGLECTTTAEHSVVTGQPDYTPLVPSAAAAADGKYADTVTYTLTKEFSIPANTVLDVSVTYPEPVKDQSPASKPSNYSDKAQVKIDDATGTAWFNFGTAVPTEATFTNGTSMNIATDKFRDSTYYKVEATITPETGHAFVTGNTGADVEKNTRVTINGVIVHVGGSMGVKTDASGKEIGWAMAVANGSNIIAKYIVRTEVENRTIVSVETSIAAPSANGVKANIQPSIAHAFNENGGELRNGVEYKNLTWYEYNDTTTNWDEYTQANFGEGKRYKAVYTVDTKPNYTYRPASDFVDFTINSANTPLNVKNDPASTTVTSADGKTTLTWKSATSYEVAVEFDATTADTAVIQVTVDYKVPVTEATTPEVDKQYTQTSQVDLYHDALATGDAHGSTWHQGGRNGAEVDGTHTFNNGDYTVVATFNARDGFVFTTGTTFIVNGTSYKGSDANSHVTLTNNGKTATVWHTFPGLDKEIVRVLTAVTKPVAGATAQSAANTTLAANKSNVNLLPDGLTSGGAAGITWTKTSGGTHTGAFDYSTAYTATFDLAVNDTDGYSYRGASDFVDFLVKDYATVLNVKNDTATGNTTVEYTHAADGTKVTLTKKDDKTYTVKIDFSATEDDVTRVLAVRVHTNLPPVHGSQVPAVYVSPLEPYEGLTGTLKWQKSTDGTTWEDVAQGTPFEAGVKYRVTSQVQLKNTGTTYRDYDITTNTTFRLGNVEIPKTADGTTTVNVATGVTAKAKFEANQTPTDGVYPDETVYTMTLTFDDLADNTNREIIKVAANVIQPVLGQGITTTNNVAKVTALNADNLSVLDHVNVSGAAWRKSTDGTTWSAASGNFEADTYYEATFTVTADTANSYYFRKGTVADANDYVDFLVNNVFDGTDWINGAKPGVTDPVTGIEVTTAQNGGTDNYTVTVTFPLLRDTADVLTVWGIAEPEAWSAINANTLTVPTSEPYQKATGAAAGDTQWMHWDGSDWEPAAGSFTPGQTYKAVIKVEMRPENVGKYQFTNTTAGYINDTTVWNNATNNTMVGTHVTYTEGTGTTANPQYVTIERVFPLERQTVDVHVSSLKPLKDNNLPTAITEPSAYQNFYEFETVDTKWTGTEPVTEGETYTMTVRVTPKVGYALPTGSEAEAKYHFFWDENGATAATWTGDADQAVVTFTYTLGGSAPQPKDPVVWIDPPVKGQALDRDPVSPNTSVSFVPGGTSWTSGGSSVTTAEAGKSYEVKIYINPNSPDGDRTYREHDEIDLDGQKVNVQSDGGGLYITRTWTLPGDPPPQTIPGGGSTTVIEDYNVNYWLSTAGTSDDAIGEHVAKNKSPKNVPTVTALNGYTFLGWSLDNPAKVADPKLVDPKTVKITEDTTFYAIYKKDYDHSHYVIGFPDGTFGPDNNITRGQVATIIARACLDGFQEGANYGNPGGYSDVSEHWAYSAISYCSMHNVFTGYEDGTFRPDAAISRQELATAVARLGEMQTSTGVPFTDSADVAAWAQDAVYTAYANGWIKGYEDGTFLPENDIKRSETVTIFNGYLERTVNKEGLSELSEYVHSGVASNLQGGDKAYMTWPDVPESHWAYYEIIEAANDHDYHKADEADPKSTEMWETAKIDEIWRYHDDLDDGADRVDDLMNGTRLTAAEAKAQAEAEAKAKAEAEAKAKAEAEAAAKAAEEAAKAEEEAKAAEEAARAEAEAKAAEEAAKAEEEARAQAEAEAAAKAAEEAAKAETNPSETMIHRAYINGFEDGTFRPDASITRAAVASVIAKTLLEGYDPDVTYETDLVDLDEHWAKNYVAFCVQNGIFGGYEDDTFRPDQGISRQEFAVVLAKLSGLTGEGELTFTDSADVAGWAVPGVIAAVDQGWLKGYEDGTFLPEKLITRAEAVKIFNSYLGRGVNYNGLSGVTGGSIWSDVSPTHWAYLEIVEAANDHTYHWSDADDPTPPERWETAGEI